MEHPEDLVLSGDLSVLNWFTADSKISVKIDGSPAIVWGTNPATGNFFVGTKSVFNKVKIKINESHEDIDTNHSGKVARILHECYDNLPFLDGIYQGDFIGFGGDNVYQPNLIAYAFSKVIDQPIIIAPHTYYEAHDDLRNAVVKPFEFNWADNEYVKWIEPEAEIDLDVDSITTKCNFAKQIATLCEFPDRTIVARVKKHLNRCIKEGVELDDLVLHALADYNHVDINVLRLWKLVSTIKMQMLDYIMVEDNVECYINGEDVGHEGYVLHNEFGSYKIVDREVFSRANFLIQRP